MQNKNSVNSVLVTRSHKNDHTTNKKKKKYDNRETD